MDLQFILVFLRFFLFLFLGISFSFLAAQASPKIEFILFEDFESFALIATPLSAKLSLHGELPPPLLAFSSNPQAGEHFQIQRLTSSLSGVLWYSPLAQIPQEWREAKNFQKIRTLSHPFKASLSLASSFWQKSPSLVLSSLETPEASILGSSFASHLKIPLLLLPDSKAPPQILQEEFLLLLKQLEVQNLYLAVAKDFKLPSWLFTLLPKALSLKILGIPQLQQAILKRLDPQGVQNLIVTTSPQFLQRGSSPWLAPYFSLVRKAPLCFASSPDGREVEKEIFQYIQTYGLKPRFLTILATEEGIGLISYRNPDTLKEYDIAVEPCSIPLEGFANPWSVGRIPYTQLRDLSWLLARGFLRERLMKQKQESVVMIANLQSEFPPLPLAETISRLSALEFKNAQIPLHEFYQKPPEDPALFRACEQASLILYGGHIRDQNLFVPEDIFKEEFSEDQRLEEKPAIPLKDPYKLEYQKPIAPYPSVFQGDTSNSPLLLPLEAPHSALRPSSSRSYLHWNKRNEPLFLLEGLPLVFFQSCFSLESYSATQAFQAGAIAFIASMTPVHSASGSSFMKSMCDSLIYDKEITIGEAFRNARNYFLALAHLKEKRGHQETATVYRTALTFRLWGDPELRLFSSSSLSVQKTAISAQWKTSSRLQILLPEEFLPFVETSHYTAQLYPRSQTAGMVKKNKEAQEQRQVLPLYFFKLPLPSPSFSAEDVHSTKKESIRSVFLRDPWGEELYVLYFPQKRKISKPLFLEFFSY
jgi:hypothetical protein